MDERQILIRPYEGTDPFIFVSYSHKNRVAALSFIERLQKDRYRVWYDDGIHPGTEWDEYIARYVSDCSMFLALLTEEYLQSSNCRDELSYARNKDKTRVLVYLEDIELPPGMELRVSRIQNIHKNHFTDENAFFEKLYTSFGIDKCKKALEDDNSLQKDRVHTQFSQSETQDCRTPSGMNTDTNKNDVCTKVSDLIPLYVSGKCTEEERTAVEQHCSVCPDCKSLLTQKKEQFYKEIPKEKFRLPDSQNQKGRRLHDNKPDERPIVSDPEPAFSSESGKRRASENSGKIKKAVPFVLLLIAAVAFAIAGLFLQIPEKDFAIDWKDTVLEAKMRSVTGISSGEIMYSDVSSISQLDLSSKPGEEKIHDISALSCLNGLTSLDLSGNQIQDISPLKEITKLESLRLRDNKISDISALSKLTDIVFLSLYENQISDISPLKNMSNLTELYLGSNRISDITVLQGLVNLEVLYLGDNQISSIQPLSNLTKLTELHLDHNQITDVSSLGSLTSLTELYLNSNQIRDISSLCNLKNLKILYLSQNDLTDYSAIDDLKLNTLK